MLSKRTVYLSDVNYSKILESILKCANASRYDIMYSHPIGEHSLNVLAAIAAGRDKPSVSITGGLFPKQKGTCIMGLFDLDNGEYLDTLSDGTAIDRNGHIWQRNSDGTAIDLDTGDFHFVSPFGEDNSDSDLDSDF